MPAISPIEADLIELFSSIQGEGLFIGRRQAFLRFANCNLDCSYCDTPFQARETYRVENEPGSGSFANRPNPADLNDITAILEAWIKSTPGLHHSLSLTGGEPLLNAGPLQQWLPTVREHLPVFLETNGTLPEALEQVVRWIDWISMDIKLTEDGRSFLDYHATQAFLRIGADKIVQAKIIVEAGTCPDCLTACVADLSTWAPRVPLVLQPMTVEGGFGIDGHDLMTLQAATAGVHPDVRVIPQVHPVLNVD